MNKKINFELAKLLDGKNYPFEFATVGEIERVPLNIPAIAEVLMWLYETRGIWIMSSYELNIENHQKEWFWVGIKDGEEIAYQYKSFNSPTEAYEAAIKHILENLIQGDNN